MRKIGFVIAASLLVGLSLCVALIAPVPVQAATDLTPVSSSVSSSVSSRSQPLATTKATTATSPATTNIDQWLPDQKLQQLVLYWLNQTATATTGKVWQQVSEIQPSDLAYLTEISNYTDFPSDTLAQRQLHNTDAPAGSDHYSLAGLQYATNLQKLDLQSADLNTAETTTIRGDITDLTPLAQLHHLTTLNLLCNQITDITPLAGLPALKDLTLSYNAIADSSSLNPAQYHNLAYDFQAVVLPLAYVGTGQHYQMDLSSIKLPGNQPVTLGLASGAGGAVMYSDWAARYYFKGGQDQLVNGQVVYTNLQPQITPGFVEGQVPGLPAKVIQNPYCLYLDATAGIAGDSVPTFQIFQPYTLATDLAKIMVRNTTIYTGESWQPQDNLLSAQDHQGQNLALAQLAVSRAVNVQQPGTYEITYRYGTLTRTAQVTVKQNQQRLAVHNSTIVQNAQWTAENNFDHVFDRDGQPVAFKNIQVTGTVDSQHPGKYQVTYHYRDLQQVATITVQPLAPTTPQPGSKPTPQPAPKPTVTHKKVTSQSARKKAASSTKQLLILPRTDETTSTVLLVAGLVLLLFSGLALTRSFNDRH